MSTNHPLIVKLLKTHLPHVLVCEKIKENVRNQRENNMISVVLITLQLQSKLTDHFAHTTDADSLTDSRDNKIARNLHSYFDKETHAHASSLKGRDELLSCG